MGIDGIKGIENMSGRPTGEAQPADSVIKGIQEEISEVQRQRQQLSSKEDLPDAEKVKKRQELQQKISDLNRELRQRQAEVRKEQQRETLAKANQNDISSARGTDKKNANPKDAALSTAAEESKKTDNTKAEAAGRTDTQNENVRDTGTLLEKADSKASSVKAEQDKTTQLQDFDIPKKTWKALVKSDSSREQARKQETVIARIEGGIAILKSEIKLDEARGANVEKKQEELKRQNEKLHQASAAQFTSPSQLNLTAEKTAPAKTGTTANPSEGNGQTAQSSLFKDIAVSLTI